MHSDNDDVFVPEMYPVAMQMLREMCESFAKRFGCRPTHGAMAPGRINLIGEHTDYNDGLVLPMAIDRHVVMLAAQRDNGPSVVHADDLDLAVTVDFSQELVPIPADDELSFANYVLGVVDEFQRFNVRVPNLMITARSTVPIGAGLSSSAAIEVATATLLEQVTGISLDPVEKALLAQRAEHRFAGTPCGIMDMFISSLAQPDHALLLDCRSHHYELVPMPTPDAMQVLIIDTGVKHRLADGAYAERRASCETAARALGVSSLRDATVEQTEAAAREGVLDNRLALRAHHVVTEIERTKQAGRALSDGDIAMFCDLMFASHDSLRDSYEVSRDELDVVVNAVRSWRDEHDERRLGARMTGGGFGGCAIALSRSDQIAQVREQIERQFEVAFDRRPAIFASRAVGGARAIDVDHVG